jgi:hypothetical protein
MSTVTLGNPVTLDALFAQDGQPSPVGVVFQLQMPDGDTVTFTFGVDDQVTNPSPDYFECALGTPDQIGEYRWRAIGSTIEGATTETIYGTVFVVQSVVNPIAPQPSGPTLGPCYSWVTGEDVAACTEFDYGSNPSIFDNAAIAASMALYEISGRQWVGMCERKVRPCSNECVCWLNGPISYGNAPFYWTAVPWGFGGGWAWYNEQAGLRLGCDPMSVVRLGGYPVREILYVTLDGNDLPEFDPDTNARNWRLDKWRFLVRMDEPGDPSQPRFWPGCQNMSLDPTQPGTFEVAYRWGVDPPELGRMAALELANQLWLTCNAQECILPVGAVTVERQGITIERGLFANWADPKKPTGLVSLDLFLQAYCQGARRGRRSMVWSPDVQEFARAVGTDYRNFSS